MRSVQTTLSTCYQKSRMDLCTLRHDWYSLNSSSHSLVCDWPFKYSRRLASYLKPAKQKLTVGVPLYKACIVAFFSFRAFLNRECIVRQFAEMFAKSRTHVELTGASEDDIVQSQLRLYRQSGGRVRGSYDCRDVYCVGSRRSGRIFPALLDQGIIEWAEMIHPRSRELSADTRENSLPR